MEFVDEEIEGSCISLVGEDGDFEVFPKVTASSYIEFTFGSNNIIRGGKGRKVNPGF